MSRSKLRNDPEMGNTSERAMVSGLSFEVRLSRESEDQTQYYFTHSGKTSVIGGGRQHLEGVTSRRADEIHRRVAKEL